MEMPLSPRIGMHCVVSGLVSKPELNGRVGLLQDFDAASQRFDVSIVEVEPLVLLVEPEVPGPPPPVPPVPDDLIVSFALTT